jgi:hypothetical protein
VQWPSFPVFNELADLALQGSQQSSYTLPTQYYDQTKLDVAYIGYCLGVGIFDLGLAVFKSAEFSPA